MILGFIFFWPVGLAVLAFLIWSGRMGCWRASRPWPLAQRGHPRGGGSLARRRRRDATSGNRAFDEYRADTLRRLEEEQREFLQLPRPPALCQGQGRVRPIPGRAPPARGAATAAGTKLGRASPVCGHYWGVCLKNRLPADVGECRIWHTRGWTPCSTTSSALCRPAAQNLSGRASSWRRETGGDDDRRRFPRWHNS